MKPLSNWLNRKRQKKLIAEMTESRPLPIGRADFEAWSDRIIAASMVEADVVSLKYALANIIMQLKPTEDHCEDAYFIKSLRKAAVNQTADAIRREIYDSKNKVEASN